MVPVLVHGLHAVPEHGVGRGQGDAGLLHAARPSWPAHRGALHHKAFVVVGGAGAVGESPEVDRKLMIKNY